MDEICIKSKFMAKLVSMIIKKVIKTKLNCVTDIQLKSLSITTSNDHITMHIDSDLTLTKAELNNLIKMYLKE